MYFTSYDLADEVLLDVLSCEEVNGLEPDGKVGKAGLVPEEVGHRDPLKTSFRI